MATAGASNRVLGSTVRRVELAVGTAVARLDCASSLVLPLLVTLATTVVFLGRGLWFVSVAR